MRIGDRVTYVDPRGKRHAATITAVPGTGASGFKTLNVAFDGGNADEVVHGRDRVKGAGYWLLATETEELPERRAELEKQPIALAKAEDAAALPPAGRRASDAAAPTSPPPKRRRKRS